MTTSKAVRHTFGTVLQGQSSLGAFVKLAIEGVGDDSAFGGSRLEGATELHGQAAARELLQHLKALPAQAKCATTEEFVIGYVPKSELGEKELAIWDALQAEAFALMMADFKSDPYAIGKRLIAAIRQASDFASPRLSAWGVAGE
jgi:hypothetical protein